MPKFFENIKEGNKAGYTNSQYNVGVFYKQGKRVLRDYMQAVKWYKKTAEQGFTSLRNLELLGPRMYFASGSFTECNRKLNLLLIWVLGINSAKITSG